MFFQKRTNRFKKRINDYDDDDDDDGEMDQSAECDTSSEEIDIIDYSMHQFIAKYEARNLMASDDSSLSSMKLAIPWAVATVMLMLRKFPGLRRPP